MAPISAAAEALGFFFAPNGDKPASVPSRVCLDAGSVPPEPPKRASAKFHVAALASHSAHRRIEPVTFPPAARRAWRRGDGLHAAAGAAGEASTLVAEEASGVATVHPQSASVVAARRRAGEVSCGASVTSDVDNRATRSATAAGANRD